MNPKLVCRISAGKNGTAYAIGPNMILTASHVISKFQSGDELSLFFPDHAPLVQAAEVAWNGKTADDIDVAILRVDLPLEVQPKRLNFLRTGLDETVNWEAHGYARKVRHAEDGGPYRFSGTQFPRAHSAAKTVDAACISGPIGEDQDDAIKDWKGVSGASVFECHGRQRLLGVVIEYVENEHQPTLKIVRMPHLFAIDSFRELIDPTGSERLQAVRSYLITALCDICDSEDDREILIAGLAEIEISADPTAESIAVAILNCTQIPELMLCLMVLADDKLARFARNLADMAEIVLPLNYAADPVADLRSRLQQDDAFWLLEGTTRTSTLAEIILAGFDLQPTNLPHASVTGDDSEIKSDIGFDISDDEPPVEGPDPRFQNVYNTLKHIRNLVGIEKELGQRQLAEIEALRADLDVRSRLRKQRTTYCIVSLSQENAKREQQTNILRQVCQALNEPQKPRIIFVERVPKGAECKFALPGEGDVQARFRQLLLQAHSQAK